MKKLLLVCCLLAVLLAACNSAATFEAPTQVVETAIPVQPTNTIPPKPTIDPKLPVPGGKLVIGTTQPLAQALPGLVSEGLLMTDSLGNYEPVLAAEMPSASPDGLIVTYKLRNGIQFSDGSAFNCQSVKAALDAILASTAKAGYEQISSLDCPDPQTVVLTFGRYYAPYRDLFGAILVNGAGTGPWMIEKQGETEMVLAKNPDYREVGKPYLDQLIIKLIPDDTSGLEMLAKGELDLLWNIPEVDFPALAKMEKISVVNAPTGENELLVLNFADPSVDAPVEAAKFPHPALSDLRVRQAIQLGIDKQKISAALLIPQIGVGTSVLPIGEFNCIQSASQFDPAQAKALLDEAGWVIGEDGIRQKDGKRLSLKITSTSGDPLREKIEKMLVTMMKEIGIELVTENVPSETLFAGWEANGLRKHGTFDLLLYTSGPVDELDPDGYLFANFHSARIPTEENSGLGNNFSRYSNADLDAWLDEAARNTDLAQRKDFFCRAASQINQDLPRIFLYERQSIAAYRSDLQNFAVAPGTTPYTQGSQNWWLRP